MCRSSNNKGISCKENKRLTITAFCLRLSASNYQTTFPETLALLYLPRINGGMLEINDAKFPPASAALVELHRVRLAEKQGLRVGDLVEAAFTSTDRVRASEGVRFEVYVKDEKVVKGVFRRDEEEAWKVECQSVPTDGGLGVSAAEICVAGEGCGLLKERVEMKVVKKRWGFLGLEEIPEESENETDSCDSEEMETGSSTVDGWDEEDEEGEEGGQEQMLEREMEGVRWAVDFGIWVMCLGVGILVSRASPRRLMGRRAGKFV